MRRLIVILGILFAALFAVPSVVAAPQARGSATIAGTVLGPDDRPVPHASVSYQSSSGSAPHVVRADSRGHFTISKLVADAYDLRASGRGVFSDWQKNINLRTGQTKTLTLHLIYAKDIPKAYVKTKPKPQQ